MCARAGMHAWACRHYTVADIQTMSKAQYATEVFDQAIKFFEDGADE